MKDRIISTDSDASRQKVVKMAARIRELEDALALFQATVSTSCHPLLTEELLSIKYDPEHSRGDEDDNQIETLDTFGTLTIGEHGNSKYFGGSGGSEVSH